MSKCLPSGVRQTFARSDFTTLKIFSALPLILCWLRTALRPGEREGFFFLDMAYSLTKDLLFGYAFKRRQAPADKISEGLFRMPQTNSNFLSTAK